jgi:signal transduction histidine kinase
MPLRLLKQLTLIFPILFIGLVLFVFAVGETESSRSGVFFVFLALTIGALVFTFWVFRLVERREEEIDRRSNQLSALHDASLFMTEELQLGQVLQKVVDQARVLAGAKYGALGVLHEDGNSIDQFIVSGMTPEQRSRLKSLPHGYGLLGVLIKEGESIRIPNIASDSRSIGFPPNHPDMTSLMGVPIKFKGEILGDLYLTDKMDGILFSGQDQLLLEKFASQAAIAIKNAQHYRLSQQLTLLQERERFGMDLHDGIIQSIYAVGLMLESTQYEQNADDKNKAITQAIDGLNGASEDIRNYILDLRPQRFQGRHLPDGLEELAREVRAHTFLDIDIQIETEDWQRLSPEQTIEILYVARESLTNIRKHAHASRVEVDLKNKADSLMLTIVDNGNGFEPGQLSGETGNGLRNMRERAQILGGKIEINKLDDGGTQVTLFIPQAELS